MFHVKLAAILAIMTSITTVQVYRDDLAWLKRKQLELSATRGEIMHLPEVVHAVIEALTKAEEGA